MSLDLWWAKRKKTG